MVLAPREACSEEEGLEDLHDFVGARIQSVLGSEEDLAFRMDSIFSSNLVYLTERQIGAVREFCSGQSDKYFLVGSSGYTIHIYPYTKDSKYILLHPF